MGKIHYSSELGTKSKLKNPKHAEIVDKVVYAFNSDLESMVYNLNYRWLEMVQTKVEMEMSSSMFPKVEVKTGKMYPNVADVRESTAAEQDETGTQPDEDTSYMDIDVDGGRKKRNRKKSLKKRKRTRAITKRRRVRRSKCRPSRA